MQKVAKRFFIFFLVFICIPPLQHAFEPVFTHGLDGSYIKPKVPSTDLTDYLNGRERKRIAKWVKYNFGFMPDFVRLRNQLNYWFFDEINSLLLLGKEETIFDPNYIDAFTGADLVPEDSLNGMVSDFQVIFNSLEENGKKGAILLAPNKAEYYKDYWPEQNRSIAETSNFKLFKRELIQNQMPFIDFNSFLLNQKDTASYPLYPRQASHWSYYGAYLAADSLLNWINENHDSNYQLKLKKLEISETPRYPDDDYTGAMNMIVRFTEDSLAYPEFSLTSSAKPKVLFIGDSFFWNWSYLNINQQAYDSNSLYFYYNKTVHNMQRDKLFPLEEKFALAAYQEADFVFFISCAPNLKNMLPETARYWSQLLEKEENGIQ